MSLRKVLLDASVLVLGGLSIAACAATGDPGDAGDEGAGRTEPIIGGTVTKENPSVVLVKAEYGNYGSWCTGTVIAKRLVLTAAHCVEDAGPGTKMRVMFGWDYTKATDADHVKVTKWHMDPQYMVTNNIAAGHDAAVLVLASDALAPAIPINKKPLTKSMVGSPVHVVGFGNDNGKAGTGSGIKREIFTTLHSLEQGVMNVGKSGQTTCQGDSGGPSFMKIDGVDVVAGITSYGEFGCVSYGSSTRVDLSAAWIQPFIDANGGDPVPDPGPEPDPDPGPEPEPEPDPGPDPEPEPDPDPECKPACDGKECGDDGCGGICGVCGPTTTCSASGQCVPEGSPGGCGESEPNDSAASANAVCGEGVMTGTIHWVADHDNFTFQVGAGQTYDLTLSTSQLYVMTLYKVVSGYLYEITSSFDHIQKTTPDGGTYYLEVWGANGAYSASNEYKVSVMVTD